MECSAQIGLAAFDGDIAAFLDGDRISQSTAIRFQHKAPAVFDGRTEDIAVDNRLSAIAYRKCMQLPSRIHEHIVAFGGRRNSEFEEAVRGIIDRSILGELHLADESGAIVIRDMEISDAFLIHE